MSEDPKISQRYRELPREEPPRRLDEAILAAARRAAETRPAPLVVPSGRRRWYFPLAAAAIIVLAVAVTVQIERQQPRDLEVAQAPVEKPEAKRDGFAPDPKPASPPVELRAQRDAAPAEPQAGARREERARMQDSPARAARQEQETAARELPEAPRAPAAAAPAPQARPTEQAKAKAELYRADEAARAASVLGKVATRAPEQWLQGIADLRRQGRHEEADKELAEFRRTYPDYRLSEEVRAKVEHPSARAR